MLSAKPDQVVCPTAVPKRRRPRPRCRRRSRFRCCSFSLHRLRRRRHWRHVSRCWSRRRRCRGADAVEGLDPEAADGACCSNLVKRLLKRHWQALPLATTPSPANWKWVARGIRLSSRGLALGCALLTEKAMSSRTTRAPALMASLAEESTEGLSAVHQV